MLPRRSMLAFSLCLGLAASALGQPANTDGTKAPDPDYYFSHGFNELVYKLGSSSYAQREKARQNIEAFGPHLALEPLRRLKRPADAETNRRIDELIRVLEHQQLTQQILAPKVVNLKIKDAGVQQAILELASQSGYAVQFFGDATKFADKKITLEGKLPFWKALDKLCAQAGLMERIEVVPAMPLPSPETRIRRLPAPLPMSAPAGPIVLVNRGKEKSLVSYAGAIKTEVRITRDAGTKELNLQFIISAEPRLLNHALVGRPTLERAIDDQGRKLTATVDTLKAGTKTNELQQLRELERLAELGLPSIGMAQDNRRVAQVRVKEEHAATQIKELAGKLALQVDLQNVVLARLDKIMDSAGKSADGANGGTLKVQSIKKHATGHIEAQVSLENFGNNPFGGNIIVDGNGGVIIRGNVIINGGGMVIGPNGVRINGAGNGSLKDLPDLLDAKGQKFKLLSVSGDSFNFVNGSTSRTATVVYQPMPGQAEPRELVLFGTRTHTIAVPFRFENVPLP